MKQAHLLLAVISMLIPCFAQAQSCRITSLSHNGLLTWTNPQTNLYCGIEYVGSLGEAWQAAPEPDYWNIVATGLTASVRIPRPLSEMEPDMLFFRVVCSSNQLPHAYHQYAVPWAYIVVDGDASDWSRHQPAFTDTIGDAIAPAGSDIAEIRLARDLTNLYVRIGLANGAPSSSLHFGVGFNPQVDPAPGDRFIFVDVGSRSCSVEAWTEPENGHHSFVTNGVVAITPLPSGMIEASVPFGALARPAPSFVRGWDDTTGPAIDQTWIVEASFPPAITEFDGRWVSVDGYLSFTVTNFCSLVSGIWYEPGGGSFSFDGLPTCSSNRIDVTWPGGSYFSAYFQSPTNGEAWGADPPYHYFTNHVAILKQ